MWCWFVQLLGCPDVSLSRRSSYFVIRLQSCWVVLLTNCLMLDEQFNEIYLGSNIFIRNVESCEYLQFCLLVFLYPDIILDVSESPVTSPCVPSCPSPAELTANHVLLTSHKWINWHNCLCVTLLHVTLHCRHHLY